ncbi:hypothetical protein D3C84_532380 [compost metagenome]
MVFFINLCVCEEAVKRFIRQCQFRAGVLHHFMRNFIKQYDAGVGSRQGEACLHQVLNSFCHCVDLIDSDT